MSSSDLSGAALNRAIMKAQGYRGYKKVDESGKTIDYVVFDPDDNSVFGGYGFTTPGAVEDDELLDQYARVAGIDYPGNTGKALALCLEIALQRKYELILAPYEGGVFVSFTTFQADVFTADSDESLALALAQLAWAALEAER